MNQAIFFELAKQLPNYSPEAQIEIKPVSGGLCNSNWIMSIEQQSFFVKIFGEGTESFIDRQLSYEALNKAHQMGISPGMVLLDEQKRLEVHEYLEGYHATVSSDFQREEFQNSVIQIYKKMHSSPLLGKTKTVFEMTDEHIQQGEALGAIRPSDFPFLMHCYQQAKAAFMASGLDIVPCHNDPMPGNFMVKTDEHNHLLDMKVIDFEFASNNERAYELGVFLGEMFIDDERSYELIEEYFGTLREDLVARVFIGRAIADMKWGSWAVQQRQLSDWDFDYQKYGIWKYGRARKLFKDPRWSTWLSLV